MITSSAGEMTQMHSVKQKPDLPFFLRLSNFSNQVLPIWLKKCLTFVPLFKSLIKNKFISRAPEGLTEVTVSTGILQGAHLRLNLKNESYYWLINYEPHLIRAIKDFCKAKMTIYDLGANIGYISLVFARLTGREGTVYAFEPLPENIQRIADHIALNSVQNIIHLIPCAVSDVEGMQTFSVHQHTALSRLTTSSCKDNEFIKQIEIKSLRLDDFVFRDGNPHPDIIKLDIEGGGVKAIPGMLKVVSKARPIFFMELHGPEEHNAAEELLKLNSYTICKMQKGYPKITNMDVLKWRDYVVGIP
jgi:FkbM family methyltransferase